MHVTDINRWQDLATSDDIPIWAGRVAFMSSLIHPSCTILDVGCGNQYLRKCIPESCQYTPLDCIAGDGVIELDFNSIDVRCMHLQSKYDVAFCSGVLEYIYDKEAFFQFIQNNSCTAIISYVLKENRNISNNKLNGWDDGITNQDILLLFHRAKLEVTAQLSYANHTIYCVKSIT